MPKRKYGNIIENLNPDSLYTGGCIAIFAREHGLVDGGPAELKKNMLRIRTAMNRIKTRKKFPEEGDGQVQPPGQAPYPAWYGWRWQLSMS